MEEATAISELAKRALATVASCPESRRASSTVGTDRPNFDRSADEILSRLGVPKAYRRWTLSDFDGEDDIPTVFDWQCGGICIRGATGLGKSCLASAILRNRLSPASKKTLAFARGETAPSRYEIATGCALWRRCGEVLFDARGSFRDGGKSEAGIIAACTHPELLVLDDLCSGKTTDTGWTIISEIIARRVDDEKDTIVTTNLSLAEIHAQEPRLASRLASFEEIVLKGKDRRLTARC